MSHPLRELRMSCLQTWGSFLSDKLPPVCSSSLSIFLPPSQLGVWEYPPRNPVKHLGYQATRDLDHQLWPCHLLFLSPMLKNKTKDQQQPPNPLRNTVRAAGLRAKVHLSFLCVSQLKQKQAHGPVATWTPPLAPFLVPAAAPSQTWSWWMCLRVYVHFSPSECSSSVWNRSMKEGTVERTSHAWLSPGLLGSLEEKHIRRMSETPPP